MDAERAQLIINNNIAESTGVEQALYALIADLQKKIINLENRLTKENQS
jgi:hypothetical protein